MTTEALRPPDEYDVAVEMLSTHFATPCNVRLQRHRFRERRQLQVRSRDTCPRLRERLLLEGDNLTFDHAVEVVRLREQTQREFEASANPMQRIQQQLRDSSARHDRRDNGDNGTRLPGRRRHFSCSRAYSAPSPDMNATAAAVPGLEM
ncbi:hypothetical protein HPB51_011570 [Rhipicephalus microplus]|uniref:Uncharacterized protein n=1 Tax=Rhipicephalus microplus TaxID=6941 RepID=A0A9J6EGY4_RHIMP|nr:hypothetical protein HPB51_011570 [Rhipicephalus microplus]